MPSVHFAIPAVSSWVFPSAPQRPRRAYAFARHETGKPTASGPTKEQRCPRQNRVGGWGQGQRGTKWDKLCAGFLLWLRSRLADLLSFTKFFALLQT